MNSQEKEIIELFLNKADMKTAKSHLRFFKQGDESYSPFDILLGIPMPTIKEFIKNIQKFELDTIKTLLVSEFNEARILGWALLFRDYQDPSIIKSFCDQFAENCNNWNVVDFAAPLAAKALIKLEDVKAAEEFAYHLLYKETNLWTHRFAIVMALPMIKENYFNYAIDVVDRSLEFKHELIQKSCGWILREVGKKNKNILNLFIRQNMTRISAITRSYALEHHSDEEKGSLK